MLEVTTPPPHVKSCYPPKSHQHRIPTALCPAWNHPGARPVLLSQPYFPPESSVSPAVGPLQTPTRSLPALGIWEGSRNAVWPWERPMRPPPAGGCAREGSIRIQPRCWVTQEAVVPLLGVWGCEECSAPLGHHPGSGCRSERSQNLNTTQMWFCHTACTRKVVRQPCW